jgi:hypothetical protein
MTPPWIALGVLLAGLLALDPLIVHRDAHVVRLRLVRRVIPAAPEDDGERFVIRHAAKPAAKPLLAVLVVVERTGVHLRDRLDPRDLRGSWRMTRRLASRFVWPHIAILIAVVVPLGSFIRFTALPRQHITVPTRCNRGPAP